MASKNKKHYRYSLYHKIRAKLEKIQQFQALRELAHQLAKNGSLLAQTAKKGVTPYDMIPLK